MVDYFVGITEIAEMLGISRRRVDQLTAAKAFPEPVATIAAGRIWRSLEVEQWATTTGRAIVGESVTAPEDDLYSAIRRLLADLRAHRPTALGRFEAWCVEHSDDAQVRALFD